VLRPGELGEGWVLGGDRPQVHEDGVHIIPSNFGLQDSFSVSSRREDTPEPEEFSPHCIGMGGEELMRHHVVHFFVQHSDGFVLVKVIMRALLV